MPKIPSQAEGRIKIGFRHADLCALRQCRQFGGADVRSSADKIGRNADGDDLGGTGIPVDPLSRSSIGWGGIPSSTASALKPLFQLVRQLWDRRLGLPKNVFRLIDVELGRGAAVVFAPAQWRAPFSA